MHARQHMRTNAHVPTWMQGRYAGLRKHGHGTYAFANGDVFEGGFGSDRMAGPGVYSFCPEGR